MIFGIATQPFFDSGIAVPMVDGLLDIERGTRRSRDAERR